MLMSTRMPEPTKRLLLLEKLTREGSVDAFHWYGLAMEYRALERHDEAIQTFTQLRATHPDYVSMYLMCGQMLASLDRKDEAREWLRAHCQRAASGFLRVQSHVLKRLPLPPRFAPRVADERTATAELELIPA